MHSKFLDEKPSINYIINKKNANIGVFCCFHTML